jgi:carbon starvation protein
VYHGRGLSFIAKEMLGKRSGLVISVAVLFIPILTLARLSLALVNAMFQSLCSTYTALRTITLIMGAYMFILRLGTGRARAFWEWFSWR